MAPATTAANVSIDSATYARNMRGCYCCCPQVHRALLRGRHPVAVKMLTDPDLRGADTDTLRSFREELVIMAKLDHPHILRCYGGNLDVASNPFIVTELCECSLDKVRGADKGLLGKQQGYRHPQVSNGMVVCLHVLMLLTDRETSELQPAARDSAVLMSLFLYKTDLHVPGEHGGT